VTLLSRNILIEVIICNTLYRENSNKERERERECDNVTPKEMWERCGRGVGECSSRRGNSGGGHK
jgi:hypothetical protein